MNMNMMLVVTCSFNLFYPYLFIYGKLLKNNQETPSQYIINILYSHEIIKLLL